MLKYCLTLILFSACTSGPFGDKTCTTVARGQFPALTTPDSLQWSIVDFREIRNHCLREKFVYVGTYGAYHLIIWDHSDPDAVTAEHNFAVLSGTFSPKSVFEYGGRAKTSASGSVFR